MMNRHSAISLLVAVVFTTATAFSTHAEEPVHATKYMVSTANPFATKTALKILRKGGSAVDAAIAAQMVLNLVEPQSSGIGGGAFMLHFDAGTGKVVAYDGRETAPSSAEPGMFLHPDGTSMGWNEAVVGGLSVGVPGVVRMLELAHQDYGKLKWADLFTDAIHLARTGFPVSQRFHDLTAANDQLHVFPKAAAYFFEPDGSPRPVGSILKNPALANTLDIIAKVGAEGFYSGPVARDISATIAHAPRHPTVMTQDDIASYRAKRREPVCLGYRGNKVCGMPPPSSGGITTLQILGILENFDLSGGPDDVKTQHLIMEASRLAFADRNAYLGDPDVIHMPAGLLDKAYLASRADLIDPARDMGAAKPGNPEEHASLRFAPGNGGLGLDTSHFSIVDGNGNAVSITSSVETAFGSRLMVRGFLLNNQLTDFSWRPEVTGKPVANAVAPGKRPRSSMAPTLVLDSQGKLELAIGSPGGSSIIGYVTETLIANLDWGLNIQDAIDLPHVVNKNGKTLIEKGTTAEALIPGLKALGHDILVRTMNSGLHGVAVTSDGLEGGADPRREGIALGD